MFRGSSPGSSQNGVLSLLSSSRNARVRRSIAGSRAGSMVGLSIRLVRGSLPVGGEVGDRKLDRERGARSGWAGDGDRAAARSDTIDEADEAGPARGIRAAATVVAHLEHEHAVLVDRTDVRVSSAGVLDGVRERFGDDEVRRRLDRRRKARGGDVNVDRHLHTGRERHDARPQPAPRESRRQDAAHELRRRGRRLLGVAQRVVDECPRCAAVVAEGGFEELERDDGVDQALLSAVVQITLDAPARGVGGRATTRARDAVSSARASAFPIAAATSPANFASRSSVPAGSGSPCVMAPMKPHIRPSTMIGAPAPAASPIERAISGADPGMA